MVGRVVDGLFVTGPLMAGGFVVGCGLVGCVVAGADGRLTAGAGFGVSTIGLSIGRLISAFGFGDGLLPSIRSRLLGLPLPLGGRATGVFFAGAFSVVDGRVGLGTGRFASGRVASGREGAAGSAPDLPTGFGLVAGAGAVDSGRLSAA